LPASRQVPAWLSRDLAPLRELATAAGRHGELARSTLDRVDLHGPVVRAVEQWQGGGGASPLRTQLLAAGDVNDIVGGLVHLVPEALGGTAPGAPSARALRPPTATLDHTQAALAVAAITSARTPEEAVAFALLTIPATDELGLLRQRASILRRLPRPGVGPGGRGAPLRVPPLSTDDRPLRLPPDLDVREPGVDRPKVPGWESIEGWLDALLAFEPGDCLRHLYILAAFRRAQFDPYRIERIVPDDACPGEPVEIFGVGFGDPPTPQAPAHVTFTTAQGGTVPARIYDWSATHVRLQVPAQASPGPVGISREVATVRSECADPVPVFQSGEDVVFNGGTPVVHHLHINGRAHTPWTTTPTSEVTLSWDTSPAAPGGAGSGHTVTLFVATKPPTKGATETPLFSGSVAPGPGRYGVTVTNPMHLRAIVRVTTRCDEHHRELDTFVTAPMDLEQLTVEITQTIQRHDPSGQADVTPVPLVPGRDAAVRVYARPAEGWFDWGSGRGVLPVAGELLVDVAGVDHRLPLSGTVSATTPTMRGEPAPEPPKGSLADPPAGLLQVIGGPLVTGDLQVRARLHADPVQIRGLPDEVSTPVAEGAGAASTWPPQRVRTLLPVLIELPAHRGSVAPTIGEWMATVTAGMARVPLAPGEWRVLHPPSRVTADADLRLWHDDGDDERDAWGDLVELVDEARTDRGLGAEVLAIGVLPDFAVVAGTRGMARDRGSAFVTLPNRPRVFAHEFAHLFGVDHGNCWNGDTPPLNIDTSLPTKTEEVGLDLVHPHGTRVVRQGTAETMTYCSAADAEDGFAWGSIVLWERLRELFGRRR